MVLALFCRQWCLVAEMTAHECKSQVGKVVAPVALPLTNDRARATAQ